jgi:uncharacterized protein YndB with AHSA1/START domain
MTFDTTRDIPASPHEVFAAFADGAVLATWWGPDGFTNTFETFDFTPGGAWVFTMHGPDGANYENRSVFVDIEPDRSVTIQHVSPPVFELIVVLEKIPSGTRVNWSQAFADADVAKRVAHIVIPANEQNLNRLTAAVARMRAGA